MKVYFSIFVFLIFISPAAATDTQNAPPTEKETLLELYTDHFQHNHDKSIDPSFIENFYTASEEKGHFLSLLAKDVIRKSKHGAGYPIYKNHHPAFIVEFLKKNTFEHFETGVAWDSLINYWLEVVDEMSNQKRTQYLLEIANLQYFTNHEQSAIDTLKKIKKLSNGKFWENQNFGNYLKLARKLQLSKYNLNIDLKDVSPLNRAELLLVLEKDKEAAPILLDEKERIILSFNEEERTKDASKKIKALRKIAALLYKAGQPEEALVVADKSVELEKNDVITVAFINNDDLSKLYREIGHPEKALTFMQPYIDRNDRRTCKSFNNSWQHAECATELVYLGFPTIAYKKAFRFCKGGKRANCGPIVDMYKAAIETGVTPPPIKKVISSIAPKWKSATYRELAIFHFTREEKSRGNALLENAVKSSPRNACNLAYISIAVERLDLFAHLFPNQDVFFSKCE